MARWLTAMFGVLLCGLILASHPRLTGDASEYLTLAQRFDHFQGPSLSSADVRAGEFALAPLANTAGRYELWHFWLFPLLVAPLVALATVLHQSPVLGFTLFNSGLLLYGCWSVARRFGPWTAALLFFSPIVWWSDKAQVEAFTVALLAIAATRLDRLSIAALWCALAATQNPPIAIFAIAAAIAACLPAYRAQRGPSWAWWLAGALVALHPVYYVVRLGRLSPLAAPSDLLVPTPGFLLTPLLDLNLGVLWTAPPFALAATVAWGLAIRRAPRRAMLAAIAGAVLLLSFAQAANVNSGGTPSLDRYAVWLFPLTVPLVSAFDGSRVLRTLIVASVVYCPISFRPSRPEAYLAPSSLALRVWTRHPAWDNPSAEVFAERLRHRDGVNTLAATPHCEKVLFSGGAVAGWMRAGAAA